jgi:hypothetical protein
LEKWKSARKVLSQFDDRLHDLRKYGFSFITALLTAESILIPGPEAQAAGEAVIPPRIKLGVMLATLLLVVGIRLMDKHYRLFQEAAAVRAKIIERSLNLELSDAIAFRYRAEQFWRYINWLYYLFAGTTGLLGVFILYPDAPTVIGVLIGTLVAVVAIWIIERT